MEPALYYEYDDISCKIFSYCKHVFLKKSITQDIFIKQS